MDFAPHATFAPSVRRELHSAIQMLSARGSDDDGLSSDESIEDSLDESIDDSELDGDEDDDEGSVDLDTFDEGADAGASSQEEYWRDCVERRDVQVFRENLEPILEMLPDLWTLYQSHNVVTLAERKLPAGGSRPSCVSGLPASHALPGYDERGAKCVSFPVADDTEAEMVIRVKNMSLYLDPNWPGFTESPIMHCVTWWLHNLATLSEYIQSRETDARDS